MRLLGYQPKSLLPVYTDTINVFIALGREEKIMEGDANKLIYLLKTRQKKNLIAYTERFANEDHAFIMHHAVYNAFAETIKEKSIRKHRNILLNGFYFSIYFSIRKITTEDGGGG